MKSCVMWGCGKPIGESLITMCNEHMRQWTDIKTAEWLELSRRQLAYIKKRREEQNGQ